MFVQTQNTPNPNSLKFIPGKKVSNDGSYEIIKKDPAHAFKNAKEALKGAVEGKLPIIKADGSVLPIEFTVKVSYDPSSGKIDVKKT